MYISFRQPEFCSFNQPMDFVIIFLLVYAVCQLLEAFFKRKSDGLRILLLLLYGIDEFADIHKPEFSPGLFV